MRLFFLLSFSVALADDLSLQIGKLRQSLMDLEFRMAGQSPLKPRDILPVLTTANSQLEGFLGSSRPYLVAGDDSDRALKRAAALWTAKHLRFRTVGRTDDPAVRATHVYSRQGLQGPVGLPLGCIPGLDSPELRTCKVICKLEATQHAPDTLEKLGQQQQVLYKVTFSQSPEERINVELLYMALRHCAFYDEEKLLEQKFSHEVYSEILKQLFN